MITGLQEFDRFSREISIYGKNHILAIAIILIIFLYTAPRNKAVIHYCMSQYKKLEVIKV